MRARTALAAALLAAAAAPASASAHVGRGAPAATSYEARIASVPVGLQAKVVDGDQRLWLRVPVGATVVVLGSQGEPFLRFAGGSVAANLRSPSFYLDRARPVAVPAAALVPGAHPQWRRVAGGRSYLWHEHRLHALAGGAGAAGPVGSWSVPLLVDGRRATLGGGLWRASAPSPAWFLPVAALLLLAAAVARRRDRPLLGRAELALVALTLAATALARLGRELDGRPGVGAGPLALAATTCAAAALLAAGATRRTWRPLASVAVATLGLYQGLALADVLRRGFVLAALPGWLERAAVSVSLGGGAALLALAVVVPALLEAGVRRRLSAGV